MRLNQFLAHHLGVSRREADSWVSKGMVKINNDVGQLFNKVEANDEIEYYKNGQWQKITTTSANNSILLVYKPIFVVATQKDQLKRRTVYNILPKNFHTFKVANRLDYMSEGLLVMRSDGNLLQDLTHPKFEVSKIYLIGLKEKMKYEQLKQLQNGGLQVDDGLIKPMKVELLATLKDYIYLNLQKEQIWYKITINETKNSHIRVVLGILGLQPQRLIRMKYGQFEVDAKLVEKKFLLLAR